MHNAPPPQPQTCFLQVTPGEFRSLKDQLFQVVYKSDFTLESPVGLSCQAALPDVAKRTAVLDRLTERLKRLMDCSGRQPTAYRSNIWVWLIGISVNMPTEVSDLSEEIS